MAFSKNIPKQETALVLGDLHIPFHNQRAINLALSVGQKLRPDVIFLNGDVTDCWQISRWDKNPDIEARAELRLEIAQSRKFLADLRKRFPKTRIMLIYGNHEYRWQSWIAKNARPLHGMDGMSLAAQLKLADLKIEVRNSGNKENCYAWGRLLIGHFDRVNKHSGYTAKNLLEDKSISLIQNHTHRGGCSYKRAYDRDLVAYENFCLCDRNPAYVDRPNWQLGFSVIYRSTESDFFYVEQHPIIETEERGELTYKCFYNGQCLVN